MHNLQTIIQRNERAAELANSSKQLRSELDYFDQLVAYEAGRLGEEETIELFQTLIDNGMAWKLQGHYGRTATSLIFQGLCDARKQA